MDNCLRQQNCEVRITMIKAVWILLGIAAMLLGMALIYILFLLVCDLLVDPKKSTIIVTDFISGC